MRPKTIAEVATLANSGQSFDLSLANFLDDFNNRPSREALIEEPISIQVADDGTSNLKDAYLASTAEQLAMEHGLVPPTWCFEIGRSLKTPWFASSLSSLRALLILESPPAFRSRNIFVSENALSRK